MKGQKSGKGGKGGFRKSGSSFKKGGQKGGAGALRRPDAKKGGKSASGFKKGGKKGGSVGFKKARQQMSAPKEETKPVVDTVVTAGRKSGETQRSGVKKFGKKPAPIAEIRFSTKERSTFLNGFSTRKLERKSKGHLKTKKKLIQEKHNEKRQFTSHIQKEYEKAQKSAIANIGKIDDGIEDGVLPTLEDETMYFSRESSSAIADDGFGDVVVQISSLESPEFAKISQYRHEQQQSVINATTTKE
jgi:hypothetical protein